MTDSMELPSLVGETDLTDDGVVIDLTVDPPVVTYNNRSLELDESRPSTSQRVAVRVFDLVSATAMLVLLLPVLVVLWVLVRCTSPGPAVYVAKRVGQDGMPFNAYKFRSMVIDAEQMLEFHLALDDDARAEYEAFHKLRNDPRVTGVGRFIRATSLDEIPQLFNVLRGNMSLVGPRPNLLTEPAKFGPTIDTVLRVKPGLTGLWQVSGRSDLGIHDRIMLDVEYATTRTLRQDIVICLRTAWHLVTPGRRGAY